MLRKMSGVLIGLILVTTIPIFSYGQSKVNLTNRENASVKEKIKETKVKPKESPMDKALKELWKAIAVVNQVAITIKGDESPYLITPRGATTTTRPIFEWTPVTNANRYRLYLLNVWGEPEETTAPKFTYPESKEGLPPGTYKWNVEILIGKNNKGNFSETVEFKIISAREKSQVEKELPSAKKLSASNYILTASIYLKHQFFNEAISNFQKAIDIAPDNPYAYLGLAKSYTAIGKKANVEYEKAISIFEQTLKLAGDNPDPDFHVGLSVAYKSVNKAEESQIEWEKARDSKAYHYHLLR